MGDHQHRLPAAVDLPELAQQSGRRLRVQGARGLVTEQNVRVLHNGPANGRPAHLGNAAEIGQAGQTHEQVAAHVRGFGAHGCDHRA